MSRNSRATAPAPPSKAWLDSYADAMTLLLAFFVLLFALSELDVKKYEAFVSGIDGNKVHSSDGILEASTDPLPDPESNPDPAQFSIFDPEQIVEAPTTTTTPPQLEVHVIEDEEFLLVTQKEVAELKQELQQALGDVLNDTEFEITTEPRGLVLRLSEDTLFASGSSALSQQATEVVGLVAEVLIGFNSNEVLIEGHTDDIPTSGLNWPTNWELSTARATQVLRAMTETHGLDETRLAALGRSDTRPIAANDTPQGRTKNRRTEIVVLFPTNTETIQND